MKTTLYARNLRKNQTDAEKLLWHNLRNRRFLGIKFRRQKPINGYIVDFISPDRKIIIELDGGQHNDKETIQKDTNRTQLLNTEGYAVLRFWNSEVLKDMYGVLERLHQILLTTPHPNLSPKGRGDNM